MRSIFGALKSRAADDVYGGMPIYESWYAKRGQALVGLDLGAGVMGQSITLHPSDMMVLRNNGRTPLWSAHSAGERELQRDRRRHG